MNLTGGGNNVGSEQINDGSIVNDDINANAAIANTKLIGVVDETGNESIAGVKTFTSDPIIPDEAYGAGWNGVLEPPTKNAIYDKIETMTPVFKSGVASEALGASPATTVIAHGLGKTPLKVKLTAVGIIDAAGTRRSEGVFDGSGNRSLALTFIEGAGSATSDEIYSSASYILGFSRVTSSNPFTGSDRSVGVVTVDGTNITITWTHSGTPPNTTIKILWEVE